MVATLPLRPPARTGLGPGARAPLEQYASLVYTLPDMRGSAVVVYDIDGEAAIRPDLEGQALISTLNGQLDVEVQVPRGSLGCETFCLLTP